MKKIITAVLLAAFLGTGLWWGSALLGGRADSPLLVPEGPLAAPVPVAKAAQDGLLEAATARARASIDEGVEAAQGASDWIVHGRATFGSELAASGMRVRAELWHGHDLEVAAALTEILTSNAQGKLTWALEQPPCGATVRLHALLKDADVDDATAVIPLGETPSQELHVRIHPWDATIRGVVRDNGGAPIHGAEVRASTVASTDAKGRYTVRASSYRPKGVRVAARAPGHSLARAQVQVGGPGHETTLDFTLRTRRVTRRPGHRQRWTPHRGR